MIKMTIILRRNPAMTHDEFVAYHKGYHADLFSKLPEAKQYVKRYVQFHPIAEAFPDCLIAKSMAQPNSGSTAWLISKAYLAPRFI